MESARELAGARYAALGTPDGEGGFSRFLTAGMSDGLMATLGPLPRHARHARRDARDGGVVPHAGHPRRPALPRLVAERPPGHALVPRRPDRRAREDVIGAFYLTEKIEASDFSVADQELIELLAAHAAIAITNARLYEQSRELSILSERNRLALELHDAVSQKLFSLVLTAEAAATLVGRDSAAAGEQLGKLKALAQEAHEELRALIFELRPPDLARDGLSGALRKHLDVLAQRRSGVITLDAEAEIAGDPERDGEILRIAQEALQNALRHADAGARGRPSLHRQWRAAARG